MSSISKRLLQRILRVFFTQLYNAFAWSYDLVAWIVSLGKWDDWVAVAADEIEGPRVLELGHGPGHLQVILAEKGIMTTGIDLSPQMGRIAARNLHKANLVVRLLQSQAQKLPFRSATFQQVTATFPSEYIFEPNTLSEAYRVLVPGGQLVVLPVAWITGDKWYERFAAWLFKITGQAPIPNKKIIQPFKNAGFSVSEKWIKKEGWEAFIILAKK